jgi:hypothetical protein
VYELCEDFYYKIDVEYPVATEYPRFEVKDNKVMRIVGGQIEELTLKQVYGTYTLVADHDMKQEEIRFKARTASFSVGGRVEGVGRGGGGCGVWGLEGGVWGVGYRVQSVWCRA